MGDSGPDGSRVHKSDMDMEAVPPGKSDPEKDWVTSSGGMAATQLVSVAVGRRRVTIESPGRMRERVFESVRLYPRGLAPFASAGPAGFVHSIPYKWYRRTMRRVP